MDCTIHCTVHLNQRVPLERHRSAPHLGLDNCDCQNFKLIVQNHDLKIRLCENDKW